MLQSAIHGKFAAWLLLVCIATSAAAQDPCSDVTTEKTVVVSGKALTVDTLDTTLDVAARFTVGQHDRPEIRVKLTTRGAQADLVKVVVTGSTVTITTDGLKSASSPASWAAATSCPAPLLPLAVAATAWAVTPPGGAARRVSLASSLAFVAWTVSGVDAQEADLADQECTSPLEIELELEFPRSGSLGYDQVMRNGGITLADTVKMVGCLPGYILQEAKGLCGPSITSFDVYTEPSSKAFNKWSPDARYPKECPTYIHDMFSVLGEDGKVYPTWHPPVYTELPSNYTCNFGHEHGGDPSTSIAFASEAIPFGFVNEQHYVLDPTRQRHESHVGHKLQVGNNVKVCQFNRADDCDGKKHIATCNVIIKLHQGTSSADAFVNNHHEVFLFVQCEPAGPTYLLGTEEVTYTRVDLKIKYLHGFGKPGEVEAIDQCPLFPNHQFAVDLDVLPITPADSPLGDGHRKMVDNTCVDDKILVEEGKNTYWIASNEHWVMNFNMQQRGGHLSKEKCIGDECQKVSVYTNPYFFNRDAARYYDANSPETQFVKYFVDLCYETGAKQVREGGNGRCDQVRKEEGVVTWDDPRSPWKGTHRSMSVNRVTVENPGPEKVFYSDTYGANLVTDPSLCGPKQNGVGCITQYIGVASTNEVGAAIFLPFEDWAVPSIHAPN